MTVSQPYSIAAIGQITGGKVHAPAPENTFIEHLVIDSRSWSNGTGSLFFALSTSRNDGHKYIPGLFEKGLKNFVVNNLPGDPDPYREASFIVVKDTLAALQALGATHRAGFSIPVIGITGSNGKTIVKEWLYQLLAKEKDIIRSPRSFNSQIGVPLSVWQMEAVHQLAIFEAGISEPGEMEKLEQIIRPNIGIFTNIGHAHDENFSSVEQKINEKLQLFRRAGSLVYCSDHVQVRNQVMQFPFETPVKIFTWGRNRLADLFVSGVRKNEEQTVIEGIFRGEKSSVAIPFTDDASIENALHCWATLLLLGYPPGFAAPGMLTLNPVGMRLELKEGISNCSVINDSYSSDITSLGMALDFLNQQKQHPRKTVILSDILQTGKPVEVLYSEVAELLKYKEVDRLIGIGSSIRSQEGLFNLRKEFYGSTEEFLQGFSASRFSNETILLKGARAFEFEKISRRLQQKSHETVLEINLASFIHNLNYYRSLLKSGTKVMAMVKAFSYGSGSYEIANVLQFHGVDYLAVAYADEGVELRKAGITLPVMVMNPEVQSFDSLFSYLLEPEIYNFRILDQFEEAMDSFQGTLPDKVPVHVKLDTGMHRLGFEGPDLPELVRRILDNPRLKVMSVFSHLAAADDPEEDEFTRQQIGLFRQMSYSLVSRLNYPVLRHILNSAGISRFPEAAFEMVRPGIGLYGVASGAQEKPFLRNVSALHTVISQIKFVRKGDTIGYNRSWKAAGDMTIATLPIGYADGLHRSLGNGKGKVMIHNKEARIVGNVCMDMCMVDITNIPAREGDMAEIFGEKMPLADLAKDMGTIPYEVLTGISRRVKRVYFQE